jgi:hypothetical protein
VGAVKPVPRTEEEKLEAFLRLSIRIWEEAVAAHEAEIETLRAMAGVRRDRIAKARERLAELTGLAGKDLTQAKLCATLKGQGSKARRDGILSSPRPVPLPGARQTRS